MDGKSQEIMLQRFSHIILRNDAGAEKEASVAFIVL